MKITETRRLWNEAWRRVRRIEQRHNSAARNVQATLTWFAESQHHTPEEVRAVFAMRFALTLAAYWQFYSNHKRGVFILDSIRHEGFYDDEPGPQMFAPVCLPG